jgi:dTDP-4-amino-4,6-dideoxygalactose transaminase
MKKIINYSEQFIDKYDVKQVTKALKSPFITQGPFVKKFEKSFIKKFKCKYAIAVSSGTAALHLIGISLKWKKNDIVLCSPNTFIATAASVEYCGASLQFVDIDNETFNMSVQSLENEIKKIIKKGKLIKAVIVTDYAGQPSDWSEIYKLKKKYKFQLINDNCHSIGSKYKDKLNYSTVYADAVSLSFHPVKHITTAEGGMILTNNKRIFDSAIIARSHGMIKNDKFYNGYYEMNKLGYNYRLNELSCALGLSQISKLHKFINYRKKIAKIYEKTFKNNKLIKLPTTKNDRDHSYHLYVLRINFKSLKKTKKQLFNYFLKIGFRLQVHYIPLHIQKYFKKKYNLQKKDFPNSIKFYDEALSVPIFYGIKIKTINKFCKSLKKFIEKK